MEGEGNGNKDEFFLLTHSRNSNKDDLGRDMASYLMTTKGIFKYSFKNWQQTLQESNTLGVAILLELHIGGTMFALPSDTLRMRQSERSMLMV